MDANLGIESNNRRVANLKRWLAKPPSAAARARLVKLCDPPMVMRELSPPFLPGLAMELDADTRDDAAEDGSAVCEYMLVFEADDGRAVTTHRFSVRRASDESDALVVAAGIEATKESVLILMQRHTEVMLRVQATNQQAVVQQLIQANQQLMALNEQLTARVVDAQQREDDARALASELRELAHELTPREAPEPEQQEPGQQAVNAALLQLMPVLAQRLLQGTARPQQLPPQAPPAPAAE